MANSVHFDVDDAAVMAKLQKLEAAASDLSGPMAVVGRKLQTKIQIGFRASVTPWGAQWAPLKTRNGKPLVDTGRLRSSITYRTGKDNQTSFVDVGTNVDYARTHQFGAEIKIAARSQQIYRTLTRSGELANRGRFVKKSKSNFASWATMKAHSITIPARPFMPIRGDDLELPPTWAAQVLESLREHLQRVVK